MELRTIDNGFSLIFPDELTSKGRGASRVVRAGLPSPFIKRYDGNHRNDNDRDECDRRHNSKCIISVFTALLGFSCGFEEILLENSLEVYSSTEPHEYLGGQAAEMELSAISISLPNGVDDVDRH